MTKIECSSLRCLLEISPVKMWEISRGDALRFGSNIINVVIEISGINDGVTLKQMLETWLPVRDEGKVEISVVPDDGSPLSHDVPSRTSAKGHLP